MSLKHQTKNWLNDSTLNKLQMTALLDLLKFEKQQAIENFRRTVNESARLLLSYSILTLIPTLALANDIRAEAQSYCITKSEKKSWLEPKKPEVIFSAKNQTFKLVADYGDVSLYDARNNLLDTVYTNEYVDVPHEHLDIVLSKNGWLWTDGVFEDHFVHINLNLESPKFEKLQKLPKLYESPYSFLRLAVTTKLIKQAHYSHALDRIFITGYPASWFGLSKPVAYEIVSGKVKRLPNELAMAKFLGEDKHVGVDPVYMDYPDLGGVLFENAAGQLIFYDGKNIKTVLGQYKNKRDEMDIFGKLKSRGGMQWRTHFVKGAKRILLEVNLDKKIDLYELTHGAKLNLLTTITDIHNNQQQKTFLEFFSLPNSRQIWLEKSAIGFDTDDSVMLLDEADKKFHAMLTIKRPWSILFIRNFTENGIEIIASNHELRGSNYWQYYILSDKKSSKLKCLGTFGINKSFVLDPELSN